MFSSNKGTYFFYLKVSKSNTFQEKKCDFLLFLIFKDFLAPNDFFYPQKYQHKVFLQDITPSNR